MGYNCHTSVASDLWQFSLPVPLGVPTPPRMPHLPSLPTRKRNPLAVISTLPATQQVLESTLGLCLCPVHFLQLCDGPSYPTLFPPTQFWSSRRISLNGAPHTSPPASSLHHQLPSFANTTTIKLLLGPQPYLAKCLKIFLSSRTGTSLPRERNLGWGRGRGGQNIAAV